MTDAARGLARRLRRLPERWLHPLRRWRARARLRARGAPGVVLVVCHGNICRSPYAAAALRRLVPEVFSSGLRIASAGFVGPNRTAPAEAQQVSAARGVNLAGHRSQLLTGQLVGEADLIIVMDAWQAHAIADYYGRPKGSVLVLGDLDPEPIMTRAIKDPVEQPAEIFAESYDRIDRCLKALVSVSWVAA